MANADGEEVKVENAVEVEVESSEGGEATVEPPYVMEIEVNADGQVVNQTAAQQENTDGHLVPVPEPAESTDIKSMHNYFQHPASSNTGGRTAVSNNVEVAPAAGHIVDQRLLENLVKGNNSVSVVQESGQVIIVLGQNSELSESDIEAIKLQVAKTEQKVQNFQRTEDIPIPEPSCFTEQTSEESSYSAEADDVNQVRVCYQCQAEFNSADELVRHFVQTHSTSVKCQYCDMVFPSIADANQHKKQRHVELQCTMCKKTYYGTFSLNQHIKLRHAKSSKCGSCYQYFDTREEMEEHIEKVHKFHKCMFCGKGFYFQTSLGNHIESEHGLSTLDTVLNEEEPTETRQAVQCAPVAKFANMPVQSNMSSNNFDESRASNTDSLELKITKSRPSNPGSSDSSNKAKPAELKVNNVCEINGPRKSPRRCTYKCTECGDVFIGKADLANHMNTVHDSQSTVDTGTVRDLVGAKNGMEIKGPETKDTDSKVYLDNTPNKLRRSSRGPKNQTQQIEEKPSEKIVNGTDSAPLRKSPRKRLAAESPQRSKKMTQNKNSDYTCDECGILFKSDMSSEPALLYSKHMAENHSVFVCEKCEVDFKNIRGFMAHMKSEHQPASGDPVCEYCYQEFRTERTLALHRKDNWKRCRVAIGCTYCSEVFLSTKELVSHHKRAHKRKLIHLK